MTLTPIHTSLYASLSLLLCLKLTEKSDDDSSTDDEARAEEERKRKELEAAAEATRRAEQAAAKGISPKKPKTASNAPSRTESPAPSGPNDGKRKLPTSQGTSTPEPGAREGTPGVLGKNVVKIRVNPQNLSNITSKPPSPSPPPQHNFHKKLATSVERLTPDRIMIQK